MHFCPRPSCRRAFHRECLVAQGSLEPKSSDRPLRLLSVFPDDVDSPPPRKRTRTRRGEHSSPRKITDFMLSAIPQGLVNVAQQPMVKGGMFPAGGVTGNIGEVVTARRLVHSLLFQEGQLPRDWHDTIGGHHAIVTFPGKKKLKPFLCLDCGAPI